MIRDTIFPWIGFLAVVFGVIIGVDRMFRHAARIITPIFAVLLLLVGVATGSVLQGILSIVLFLSGLLLLVVGFFRCMSKSDAEPLLPSMTKANIRLFVAIALLYAMTWIGGWTMVRADRPDQAPMVVPVMPFVIFAWDTQGSVGEISLYFWHLSGVRVLSRTLMWIE